MYKLLLYGAFYDLFYCKIPIQDSSYVLFCVTKQIDVILYLQTQTAGK